MSLQTTSNQEIPLQTVEVARAAFPKGHPYITLRDELGTLYSDEDFVKLFSKRGQPAISPWRLALITLMQFRENLSDRQAAEAVRARIDWKYLLGLELSDPGFNFSVLCEFRMRLIVGSAEQQLLELLLDKCRTHGLIKARGQQRTDSTHVLMAVRELKRLELIGETLRAALNEISKKEPQWLKSVSLPSWYDHYTKRIEDSRLPRSEKARSQYAQMMGEDGFRLLAWIDTPSAPKALGKLMSIRALRTACIRHYEVVPNSERGARIRFKTDKEVTQATEEIVSPYDLDARYRSKRGKHWVGYMVHLSESCDDETVHLITHVKTTPANRHDIESTESIHQAMAEKELLPAQHFVDSAYISAELLVNSKINYGIALVGPPRGNTSWQKQVKGAYTREQFLINWQQRTVHCPQGLKSISWNDRFIKGKLYHKVSFSKTACAVCKERRRCTQAKETARRLRLLPQIQHETLQIARQLSDSREWRRTYARRWGIEGTLSQGIRAFGLRQARYRGLLKTQLQNLATAAAINIQRLIAWLHQQPREVKRISRFAQLAVAT